MRAWLLPEYIEDVLPAEARAIERCAARLLDLFASHGYELVVAAAARIRRVAAHRHRPRSGPAHLQARRPAVGPHDGRARRHHAAGRAHRRAPAQPRRCRRGCATAAASCTRVPAGSPATARAAADRRRDLRPRRYRGRHRDRCACMMRGARRVRASSACSSTSATSAYSARSRVAAAWRRARVASCLRCTAAKDVPGLDTLTARLAAATRRRVARCCQSSTGARVLERARGRAAGLPARWRRALDGRSPRWRATPTASRSRIDLAELRGYHYHSGVVFAAYARAARERDRARRALRRGRQGVRPRAAGDRLHDGSAATRRLGAAGAAPRRDPRPACGRCRTAGRDRGAAQRGRSRDPRPARSRATERELGCDRRLVSRNGKWRVEAL